MARSLASLTLITLFLTACSGTLAVERGEQTITVDQRSQNPTEQSFPTQVVIPTPTSEPIVTATPKPTRTPSPTQTTAPTQTPEPTYTPTSTPSPRTLNPVRPVDSSVPLYHAYGIPIDCDPAGDGHNGYDYGFQACVSIDYPVVAIESGVVMQLGGEGDVWIDHGVVRLSDGTVWRVISTYSHVAYNNGLRIGMRISRGEPIAHFLTCDESGHFPELELQMIRVDPSATRGLEGQALLRYLQQNEYRNGEFPDFDPALIGLPPN